MAYTVWVLLVLMSFMGGSAAAQELAPGHVDPWPVLQAAAKAIGADQVKCVTFSGTGYAGRVGQNVTQDTDWPRGALTCTDVSESSALLIASLRRDFGGGSFYDGYITAVRVEHFILRRKLRG